MPKYLKFRVLMLFASDFYQQTLGNLNFFLQKLGFPINLHPYSQSTLCLTHILKFESSVQIYLSVLNIGWDSVPMRTSSVYQR